MNSIRESSSYLGFLKPNTGAVVGYKRLGRGPASGKGKTAGRGQKGQKARGKVPQFFEGGQTPFYKRFPIVGFKRPHKKVYHELKLQRIQEFWDNGRIPLKVGGALTYRIMRECGLLTGSMRDGVKIMSDGKEDYNVPLDIVASKATGGSVHAIEKAGNKYTAMYMTKLGLKAHCKPDYFLLKKGYLPLPARPTHRRDIEYYSNPEKRGYLLEDRSIFLDYVSDVATKKISARKSALDRQLENADSKRFTSYGAHKVVSLKDL